MWTSKDVSIAYKLSKEMVNLRARNLGIKTSILDGVSLYLFNKQQVNEIVNYNKKAINLPEIIYVKETYYIIESKMNYEI